MTKKQSALLGGVVGAGAVLAFYLSKMQQTVEQQAEQVATEAAESFIGRNYGLTPGRIARLERYGNAASPLIDAVKGMF